MERRQFLLTAAAISVLGLAGCADPRSASGPSTPQTTPSATTPPRAVPASPPPASALVAPAPSIARAQLPASGTPIFGLPVDGPYMSWTVDDGGDPATIRRYAEMARDTGIRLTFFPNGMYPGWKESADIIRPLVATGQVEIGNHTWSHKSLTSLSDAGIIDELTRNDDYLRDLFGTTVKPFYRPPFGYRDARTDAVAASIGYTAPVMWYGSLSDSGLITEAQVVEFATTWFLAKHIVIGHANHQSVCNVFPQLQNLLRERGLQTVTLRDVFQV